MSSRNLFIFLPLLLCVMAIQVSALDTTVSQSGADTDEVMLGRTFIVEATGWTGDCTQATISFDTTCPSCGLSGEENTQTIESGETTVSWTTMSASSKTSGQYVSVSVSGGGCTMQSDESNTFSIVLPPSLELELNTTETEVDKGNGFEVNVEITNSGETTAQDVTISTETSGFTVDCASISEIDEGNSAAESCTVTAGTSLTSGAKTVTLDAEGSNADADSADVEMYVNPKAGDGVCDTGESGTADCTGGGDGGDGSPGGSSLGGAPQLNRSKRHEFVPGVGLRNNTKLQAAIEKVLAKGHLSDQARENLLRLSASISASLTAGKTFNVSGGKSRITSKIKYTGQNATTNFMLFESVPKAFANSSALVTVSAPGATVEVAEADPSWVFLYPQVQPNQELTVTYEVAGTKSSTALDSMTSEVYIESFSGAAAPEPGAQTCTPSGKRCSGSLLQQCSSDGSSWSTLETCANGCDSASLSCSSAQPPGGGTAAPGGGLPLGAGTMMMVAIVVIAVAVLAVAAVFMRKSKKAKKPSAIETIKKDLSQQAVQKPEQKPNETGTSA